MGETHSSGAEGVAMALQVFDELKEKRKGACVRFPGLAGKKEKAKYFFTDFETFISICQKVVCGRVRIV